MAKISGGVKPGHLQEGGPKMAKIQYGVKPDISKITKRPVPTRSMKRFARRTCFFR